MGCCPTAACSLPDGVEPFLWILVGLIASGLALIALSVGFARR